MVGLKLTVMCTRVSGCSTYSVDKVSSPMRVEMCTREALVRTCVMDRVSLSMLVGMYMRVSS